MKTKKICLTSALCMLFALPSYADIASGANNATCNSDTIGATEGSTDLEAQWSANQYSENPGYYLLYANNTVSTNQTCTAGNYCPGFTNQTFADATMGLNSCATNDANFPNSAAGASAATDCYRACNISNMGTGAGKTIAPIAHATAISGNDYYGAGVDTCVPTSCDPGYHVSAATPNLTTVIGTSEAGTGSGYKSNDGESSSNTSTYGITQNGEFVVDYGNKGKIHGHAQCSTRSVANPWMSNNNTFESDQFTETLPNSAGQYCYCQLDGYTPYNSTMQSLSVPWVFLGGSVDAGTCADFCAYGCANGLRDGDSTSLAYRTATFGAVQISPASCEANVINIDWNPMNGGAHTLNQCTYGGAVTIPEQPTKTGYTFGGWKIKTSNSGN